MTTPVTPRYPALTRPLTLGAVSLRNRMVMSPMTTYGLPDPDGSSNERHRAYYEARARAGLGLVRVESALVHPSGRSWPNHLAVYDDRFVPGLSELARAIKRHGPPAILQLQHGGRVAVEALSGAQPLAPSPLPAPGCPIPAEMTLADIDEMVEAFGQAARRARDAGFDGVELHMGTAYLLLSFISPAQNLRRDEYGGDFAGRMRFPLQIVDRIRELAGDDYLIGARIVATDYHDGGVDLPYCLAVAKRLESAGLAYLDVSAGAGPNAGAESPLRMGGGEAVFADYAAAVKQVVSIPVMSVGRYYSMAAAETAVATGSTDLVAFGRALLADPEFIVKSLEGREKTVIPCIGCQACHGGSSRGLGVTCLLNPRTGHEVELDPRPALVRRRVLVRGSGVPALEFARVAAQRGHEVTVATAGMPFGGLLALRATVPGAAEVAQGVDYFQRALLDLGVRIVGEEPDEPFDSVFDMRPGTPVLPHIEGLDPADLIFCEDVLAGRKALHSGNVVVVGDGILAGETALAVAATAAQVTLVAGEKRPMHDAHPLVAGTTGRRLAEFGARVLSDAKVDEARDGELHVTVAAARRERVPFDAVIAAVGWQARGGQAIVDAWDAFAARLQVQEAAKLAQQV